VCSGFPGGDLPIEQAVQMLARFGKWSRHAGPEPGMSGCKASSDLLAKYGLAPDGRKLPPAEPQAVGVSLPGAGNYETISWKRR